MTGISLKRIEAVESFSIVQLGLGYLFFNDKQQNRKTAVDDGVAKRVGSDPYKSVNIIIYISCCFLFNGYSCKQKMS